MKRYLLDTNAVGRLVQENPVYDRRLKEIRTAGHRIGTCTPVIGELYFGVERSSSRQRNLVQLQKILKSLRIWELNRDAAKEYGRIAADLRRIGRPMQQVDIQVAAIAFTLGNCTVVTEDSDLTAIPGLMVENWMRSQA